MCDDECPHQWRCYNKLDQFGGVVKCRTYKTAGHEDKDMNFTVLRAVIWAKIHPNIGLYRYHELVKETPIVWNVVSRQKVQFVMFETMSLTAAGDVMMQLENFSPGNTVAGEDLFTFTKLNYSRWVISVFLYWLKISHVLEYHHTNGRR